MMEQILVCPQCGNDYFETLDQIDYGVWAVRCKVCGWSGTTDELKMQEEKA